MRGSNLYRDQRDQEVLGSASQSGLGNVGGVTSQVKSFGKRGFNLRGVAEVLIEYGLDPAAEIAKAINGMQPVVDRSGAPLLDGDGNQIMEPMLDNVTRIKALLELQQYVAPKLKATEITIKKPELSDEQIDARLDALLNPPAK